MNKTVDYVVIGVTLFLFLYAALTAFEPGYDIMFIFFMIGQILVPYMVYVVLRYGVASEKKFDTNFYDDVSEKRNTLES